MPLVSFSNKHGTRALPCCERLLERRRSRAHPKPVDKLSLTWVFKLLYPLIFSLIAVALYQVYRHQVGDRIAFCLCHVCILLQYYNGMIFLARQMIASIPTTLSGRSEHRNHKKKEYS